MLHETWFRVLETRCYMFHDMSMEPDARAKPEPDARAKPEPDARAKSEPDHREKSAPSTDKVEGAITRSKSK
ncbi:unnamed protein product [Cochlearia groenlandica]